MQLRELREYAQHRDLVIVGEYVDRMTGSKDSRPSLNLRQTSCTWYGFRKGEKRPEGLRNDPMQQLSWPLKGLGGQRPTCARWPKSFDAMASGKAIVR